ncbi:hypothetical protein N431DRAFT_469813 [Stipitochalara longipes BDJ]|nr:hypothetical protein N431DRAFT_469813 [Stipitochalara longipes BDJ]
MASNTNITLPVGTTDHGQPALLCLPTKWTDIVIFFLGNYVAHAATIRLEPGTNIVDTILAVVWALLIPICGVKCRVSGILSLAKFGKTDLQIAARAGALCQVIRTDLQGRSLRERFLTLDSGNLLCPQYSATYLVRSQAMADAEQDPSKTGLFEGVVGTLVEDDIQAKEARRRDVETLPRSSFALQYRNIGKRT